MGTAPPSGEAENVITTRIEASSTRPRHGESPQTRSSSRGGAPLASDEAISGLERLVVVARGAKHRGGLAAPGTPRASALEYRNDGIVCLLTRLGSREWAARRTDATRARRPGRLRPTPVPGPAPSSTEIGLA